MLSLPAFSGQRCASERDVEVTQRAVDDLSAPAPKRWVQGRVAALLSHYFVASTDACVIEMMAEDWWRILSGNPAWAIANACIWWLGPENEKHDRKPLPGDIAAAVSREMERVRVAKFMVDRGIVPPRKVPPAPEPIIRTTEERRAIAARVLASFGNKNAEAAE